MTCPAGHDVENGQRFCPECGIAVATQSEPSIPEQATQKRSARKATLAVVGTLALLAAGGAAALTAASGDGGVEKRAASSEPLAGGACPDNFPVKVLELHGAEARPDGTGVFLDPDDDLTVAPGEDYYDEVEADGCLTTEAAGTTSGFALASVLDNSGVSWRTTACGYRSSRVADIARDAPGLAEDARAAGRTQSDGEVVVAVADSSLRRFPEALSAGSTSLVADIERRIAFHRQECARLLGEAPAAAPSEQPVEAPSPSEQAEPEQQALPPVEPEPETGFGPEASAEAKEVASQYLAAVQAGNRAEAERLGNADGYDYIRQQPNFSEFQVRDCSGDGFQECVLEPSVECCYEVAIYLTTTARTGWTVVGVEPLGD